jgi:hypothetical protein
MKVLQATETWIVLLVGVIMTLKNTVWPDLPMTEETITGLIVWIVARLAKKGSVKVQTKPENGGTQ